MAVQVICYEIFQYVEQTSVQVSADSQSVQEEVSAIGRRIWDKDPASGVQMDKLIEHLEQVMVASGFVDPANPGNTVTRLRRLFMRQQLDETEVQILRGMLKAVQRRMK
jgi:tRNA (cytidine32/uridine32-2'-O)-methyltransferase